MKQHLTSSAYVKIKLLVFRPSDFGGRAYTPLSNISTTPKDSDLSYDKRPKHYLEEETVTPNEILPEEHWGAYQTDEEIEKKHV